MADDGEARFVERRIFDVAEQNTQAVFDRRLPAGDRGRTWLLLCQLSGGGRAGHLVQGCVGHILTEPCPTLRQRLRLAIDSANIRLVAIGDQIMTNPQPNFRADNQLRQAQEHVQRIGNAAVSRVFQGDYAKIGMAPVHLFEYCGDAAYAQVFDRLPETLDSGEMTKAVFRAKVGNLENALQGTRAAHDFAEYRANRAGIERAFVGLEHVVEDFLFARRREDFRATVVFDRADFGGDGSAFVDELQDMQ